MSAGALASPQILMVSGIGAADDLKPHGIDVRTNSKASGKNLQDHSAGAPRLQNPLPTINTEISTCSNRR